MSVLLANWHAEIQLGQFALKFKALTLQVVNDFVYVVDDFA
jgi:hypothetical protein